MENPINLCFIKKPIQFCLVLFYVGYKYKTKRKWVGIDGPSRLEFGMKGWLLLERPETTVLFKLDGLSNY